MRLPIISFVACSNTMKGVNVVRASIASRNVAENSKPNPTGSATLRSVLQCTRANLWPWLYKVKNAMH